MNIEIKQKTDRMHQYTRRENTGELSVDRSRVQREISYRQRRPKRGSQFDHDLNHDNEIKKNIANSYEYQRNSTRKSSESHPRLNDHDSLSSENQYWPLPVYESPQRPRLVIRKKSLRKILTRSLATFATLALIVSVAVMWRAYTAAGRVLTGSGTVAALSSETIKPTMLNGEGDGRVNILLLGVGGAGHDGGELTDTILLASVDPVNNKTSLVSIPRDLWVKTDSKLYGTSKKINAVYTAGKNEFAKKNHLKSNDKKAIDAGLKSLDDIVGEVIGVRINYHVLVNFRAFKQAVDTVGGVNVDVEKPLIDASMAWENDNNPVLAAQGSQTMDGDKALLYARSRHTSSDFDRSERQRQLIVALKSKAMTISTVSNPLKLESLLQTFGDNFYTDMSTDAAIKLLSISKNIDDTSIASLDLVTPPNQFLMTDRVGTQSVVRPKAGFDTYSDIQAYIHSQLIDGYLLKEAAPITVVANERVGGDDTISLLASIGYTVSKDPVIMSVGSGTEIIDLSNGKSPYTKHYLEKRFNVSSKSSLPEGITVPDSTQFAILVGQ